MVALNIDTGNIQGRAVSLATLFATFVLVFVFGVAIVGLEGHTAKVDGIWIANAIVLVMLMKHRRRSWLAIAAAGFMANIAADILSYDFSLSLSFAVLNLLEVFGVALPLRLLKLDRDFGRPNALLAFYALAAGPAPMVTAALCAALFHGNSNHSILSSAINCYAADALGLIIIAPPLMTVRLAALKAMFRKDQVVWTCGLIGGVVATILLNFFARDYPLAFLFFPAVLLLTFQRGFAGGSIGLLLTALYLIVPAIFGKSSGTLHAHSIREQIMITQIFIAVIGLSVILVGAALEERRRLEQGLAAAMSHAENSREEAIVAKEAAEDANRSKSMFLATMSHELRTPLNAVIGFAEMMNSELFGPLGDRRYREYTAVIQNAGRHLLDLINDILDMSKIEAGKLEIERKKIDLRDIVRDGTTIMAENASSSGVNLTCDLPLAPLVIEADRRAMKQILLNLLSNAIKFTPFGGSVTAKAEMTNGRIVLSVSDTGVGIPEDQIYRLGNPFVQIRNNAGTSQNGTGLGLALVRALTEMQDGLLKIDSKEGVGTIVSVSFPTGEQASVAA